MLEHPERFAGRHVGLVLSGGNIDARMLSSVLMRDLVRLGQVLTLSIAMPDKPGQLHAVAGICADLGANVLEVAHTRFAMDLSASAARLNITIETRGEDHRRLRLHCVVPSGAQGPTCPAAAHWMLPTLAGPQGRDGTGRASSGPTPGEYG